MSNLEFAIFRAGTHADHLGKQIRIDAETLAETARSYQPQHHEAPLVIGHPKEDAPAFGWVETLRFEDNQLFARFKQIHPEVPKMPKGGAFKKVSASFYPPESALNPTPGKYSLRHIGLLGAQPPAIKGLESIQFAENDTAITEWQAQLDTPKWQKLMHWLRERFGEQAASDAASYLQDPPTTPTDQGSTPTMPENNTEESTENTIDAQLSQLLSKMPEKPWTVDTLTALIKSLEALLPAQKPSVDFSEFAPSHAASAPKHVEGLISRAQNLIQEHRDRGQNLSFPEAVTLAQQENTHAK